MIGTLACRGREAGQEASIATGDRDAFQLVTDGITVLYFMRGVSEMARMNPAAVEARYGLPPQPNGL